MFKAAQVFLDTRIYTTPCQTREHEKRDFYKTKSKTK